MTETIRGHEEQLESGETEGPAPRAGTAETNFEFIRKIYEQRGYILRKHTAHLAMQNSARVVTASEPSAERKVYSGHYGYIELKLNKHPEN